MPRTAIVDTATGAILVLDPPTQEDGTPILPEGVDCRCIELDDKEAAKLVTPSARFSVTKAGKVQVERVKDELDPRAADLALVQKQAQNQPAFAALVRLLGLAEKAG